MPMVKPEDFGRNADSSRNEEYCRYCFQNGKFTEPNVTLEQMIDKLVSMASKMNMTEDQARNMANSILPQLKMEEMIHLKKRIVEECKTNCGKRIVKHVKSKVAIEKKKE
jgi:hypothetical protein